MKKIKFHLLFSFMGCLIILAQDYVFSLWNSNYFLLLDLEQIFIIWLLNLTLSFLPTRASAFVFYTVITLFSLIQFIHFEFFGSPVFPVEIHLFFTNLSDVYDTFSTSLSLMTTPLFIFLGGALLLSLLIHKTSCMPRFRIKYFQYILTLAVIFYYPVYIFITKAEVGKRPSNSRHSFRNFYEVTSYYLGHILPNKLTNPNAIGDMTLIETPEPRLKNPDRSILLVLGESCRYDFFSLYGYDLKTTPNLDNFFNSDTNFIFRKGISSAPTTDIALPSFFNLLPKPGMLRQAASYNTSLFKLAKLNGFRTYFISTQSIEQIRIINTYLGARYIDVLLSSKDIAGSGFTEQIDDINLLLQLKKIDLAKNNFIVLHQGGSHSPYENKSSGSFKKFTCPGNASFQEKMKSEYCNSILYTDFILYSILQHIKINSVKPTYFFFTADHGESMGENGIYLHNQLYIEQSHVPFIYYSVSDNSFFSTEVKKLPSLVSHYEMGCLIARCLGYNLIPKYEPVRTIYFNGPDLLGDAGYMEIMVNDSAIISINLVH